MHGKLKSFLFVALSVYLFSRSARAGFTDHIDATLGGAYEYGQLGDSDMSLDTRAMQAESIEFLPGYRLTSSWLIGLDLEYRFQQQLTALSSAGGTNIAGQSYLIGFGAKSTLSPRWSLQGAVDFVGRYTFRQTTDQSQESHLSAPISFNLKGQYFIWQKLPFSLDGILNYQSWRAFYVSGNNNSSPANQWMIGIGLTYHFGAIDFGSPTFPPAALPSPKTPAPPELPVASAATIENKPEPTKKVNVEGTAFDTGSADLSDDARSKMKVLGAELATLPNQRVVVEGYTDSVGKAEKNKRLSQARAESVKAALVAGGLKADIITAQGFGEEMPVADNSTKEGRAKNRRVEITVSDQVKSGEQDRR